jgi:competence protein ComEA
VAPDQHLDRPTDAVAGARGAATSPSPDESGAGLGTPVDLGDLAGSGSWWRDSAGSALERWRPDGATPAPLGAGSSRLIAAVVLAAALGAGAVWLRTSPPTASPAGNMTNLPLATRRADPGTTSIGPEQPAPVTAAGGSWVAVTGAVARPGLYWVLPDARLSSLIVAAGGLTDDADPDRINLAAPLRDGERIHVPRRDEEVAPPLIAGGDGAGGGSPGPTSPSAGPTTVEPVDINRATAEQLEDLPGVGPATAQAIIEHRQANGPFNSVEELTEVRGIGPAKLERLRPLVVVR